MLANSLLPQSFHLRHRLNLLNLSCLLASVALHLLTILTIYPSTDFALAFGNSVL